MIHARDWRMHKRRKESSASTCKLTLWDASQGEGTPEIPAIVATKTLMSLRQNKKLLHNA